MVEIRHQSDETKGSPTIGRRVGGEIETVGVAPVPDDQRVQTPRQMFIVWLMASASATTPLIGAHRPGHRRDPRPRPDADRRRRGHHHPVHVRHAGGLAVRAAAAAFFTHPRSLQGRFVLSAIAAVAVGFVLGFWGDEFLPGFFYNTLPLPVVAGVVAAILYGLAATWWRPPHAAAGVETVSAATPAAAEGSAS
jgi:hypothetical protein